MPTLYTLGRNTEFEYRILQNGNHEIKYGNHLKNREEIAHNDLIKIANHFSNQSVVLGAGHDSNLPKGSLGEWLQNNLNVNSNIASYIASVLVYVGLADKVVSVPIKLTFNK